MDNRTRQAHMLLCTSGKQESRVPNPLMKVFQKTKIVEERLGISIIPYLVIVNHCQFFVKENPVDTIFLKNMYYYRFCHRK